MIPIDSKKINKELEDYCESMEIPKAEEVRICLRCDEPFISINPKYYRLCGRCRAMNVESAMTKGNYDAFLDTEILTYANDDVTVDEDFLEHVSNWDSFPAFDDPWEKIDELIDLARKVKGPE